MKILRVPIQTTAGTAPHFLGNHTLPLFPSWSNILLVFYRCVTCEYLPRLTRKFGLEISTHKDLKFCKKCWCMKTVIGHIFPEFFNFASVIYLTPVAVLHGHCLRWCQIWLVLLSQSEHYIKIGLKVGSNLSRRDEQVVEIKEFQSKSLQSNYQIVKGKYLERYVHRDFTRFDGDKIWSS